MSWEELEGGPIRWREDGLGVWWGEAGPRRRSFIPPQRCNEGQRGQEQEEEDEEEEDEEEEAAAPPKNLQSFR